MTAAISEDKMRPIPAFLPTFVTRAEKPFHTAYLDQGHVWTIGAGHTGPEVHQGMVIGDATISIYLNEDLRTARRRLYGVLTSTAISSLSSNQWAALLDFVFNTGCGPHWDIWTSINAGRLNEVASQLSRFERYHDDKGVVHISKGLENRRNAEIAVWNTPDPADLTKLQSVPMPAIAAIEAVEAEAPVDVPSSAFVRQALTPPAPQTKKGLVASIWTGIGSAVTLGPPAIKNLLDTLGNWNINNSYVAHVIAILGGIGAALAVAAVIYGWLAHERSKA